jgi:hypothetical protein
MRETLSPAAESAAPPLCFRIAPRSGVWHLWEESSGAVGGIFQSIAAALAFVRGEARRRPGATVVIEVAA